jgi:glycosyltransferase involved in cell wall biosynthesis
MNSNTINKLSIGILGSRGIPARYSGFETFAEHLSVGLAKKGHDVYVYCPKYQEYKESTYQGVRLVFISNFEYLFKGRIPRAVCNLIYDIICLIHACRRSAAMHVYMLGYSAGPFLLVPRLFGKKLTVNPDGLEWKSTRWGLFARSWLYFCEFVCARYSNHLIGDAQPITDRFRKIYNAPISTIEYGTELYRDDGENLEYPRWSYYLAVARMVPETKLDVIIEGFKRVKLKNKKLIIVGPVTDRSYFESKILPSVGKDNIEYLGAIYDRIRLKKLRANSLALLHGHASDGTNPSLLESMGCASPVIAIDRESNSKVLTRANALYFIDDISLASVLRQFEDMPEIERIKMGENNYIQVRKNFSWIDTINAHENVFKNLQTK